VPDFRRHLSRVPVVCEVSISQTRLSWSRFDNNTDFQQSVCMADSTTVVLWKSQAAQKAFGVWYFLTFYVVVLVIFIFCYWRILLVIRRQARLMAAHAEPAAASRSAGQSTQIQTNVINTGTTTTRSSRCCMW